MNLNKYSKLTFYLIYYKLMVNGSTKYKNKRGKIKRY